MDYISMVREYVEYTEPDVRGQYMKEPWMGLRIYKKIGIALIDLRNKIAYPGRNIF